MQSIETSFRTIIPVPPAKQKLAPGETVLSLGSCFAEHIAGRLASSRFVVCASPTGTLYNPESIANALRNIVDRTEYTRDNLFFHNDQWKCFDYHSSFDSESPEILLEQIHRNQDRANHSLAAAGTLICTFGTSWAYYYRRTGSSVANCHRLPHDQFDRRLLSPDFIVQKWTALLNELLEMRPQLKIVLTISPVRHLRDNPHENQVSKSHLFTAVYELERRFQSSLFYFPSYEIMMDDLRDYRFYDTDMVHPSTVAVDYIWNAFVHACLDDAAKEFVREYEGILRSKSHRVKDASSPATQKFAEESLRKLAVLADRFPGVDLSEDRQYFKAFLNQR